MIKKEEGVSCWEGRTEEEADRKKGKDSRRQIENLNSLFASDGHLGTKKLDEVGFGRYEELLWAYSERKRSQRPS